MLARERPDDGAHLGPCRGAAGSNCSTRSATRRSADAELLNPLDGDAACPLPRLPQPERPALVCGAEGAELHHRRARRRAADRLRHLSGRGGRRAAAAACSGDLHEPARRRAQRVARPRAAAARLHLQLPRPADPRHPRPADQGRPSPHRYRVRRDRRPRLRACSIRCSAFRSPISPTGPAEAGWLPARSRVERLHRACAARRRGFGNCSSSGSASGSARRAASPLLCADRRLFPARAARAGARHLLARRSDRPRRAAP